MQTVRFQNNNRSFYLTARQRVDEYFKSNNISRFGNGSMVFKTIFMLALYLVPYSLIVFNGFQNPWILVGLAVLMGFGMSGIGLSVMHDANHGSYSRNQTWNKIMSCSMYLIGGSPINWQLQHNTLHHTYTNVDGHDEDIMSPVPWLRFSPHDELRKIHKWQYIYAWFFYGMMTYAWMLTKDFKQLVRYNKMGLLVTKKTTFSKELVKLVFAKIFYMGYMLAIPITFSNQPWWLVVIGFCIMHFLCGLILAMIFQPAHVIDDTAFVQPTATGVVEEDWAIHQLKTTSNFAQRSRFFTWFVGGLNHQVEHHLFPNICHVHYTKISPIIMQTAKEFNLPYYTQKTFWQALVSHGSVLKQLGQTPTMA